MLQFLYLKRQQEMFSDYWPLFFVDHMVSLHLCILWFVVEMSQKGPEKSSKHPILPPKQAELQSVILLFETGTEWSILGTLLPDLEEIRLS